MPARLQKRPVITSGGKAPEDTLASLFGAPPLIEGEDEATYEAFTALVCAAVEPADALEEIWMRDVVDLEWEVQRLRRLKGKYLRSIAREGLKQALEPIVSYLHRDEYVEGWAKRDPAMIKAVDKALGEAGLDMEHVTALALAKKLDAFEKLERLSAAAEARRNLALRELERRREALARRIQSATQIIEDAEFHEVVVAPDAAP